MTGQPPGRARPSKTSVPRWLTPAQLRAWRALTTMLARLPTALEAQLQRDAQLSYLEYYTLATLSDQPNHMMRISELAILTNAEVSRLSHLLTRLQRRGFLRREADPYDGRYTNAVLSEAGRAHLVAVAPGHVAQVIDLVVDALQDTELTMLGEIAERVIARIDDRARRPPTSNP